MWIINLKPASKIIRAERALTSAAFPECSRCTKTGRGRRRIWSGTPRSGTWTPFPLFIAGSDLLENSRWQIVEWIGSAGPLFPFAQCSLFRASSGQRTSVIAAGTVESKTEALVTEKKYADSIFAAPVSFVVFWQMWTAYDTARSRRGKICSESSTV